MNPESHTQSASLVLSRDDVLSGGHSTCSVFLRVPVETSPGQ